MDAGDWFSCLESLIFLQFLMIEVKWNGKGHNCSWKLEIDSTFQNSWSPHLSQGSSQILTKSLVKLYRDFWDPQNLMLSSDVLLERVNKQNVMMQNINCSVIEDAIRWKIDSSNQYVTKAKMGIKCVAIFYDLKGLAEFWHACSGKRSSKYHEVNGQNESLLFRALTYCMVMCSFKNDDTYPSDYKESSDWKNWTPLFLDVSIH